MGDVCSPRLRAFHCVAYRCGKDPAGTAGLADCQQTGQIILVQARTRGVMHQHPTGLPCGLQTGKDRIGTLVAAIHHRNLRVRSKWKLGKATVAWADSDDDSRHPGMSQQRINRVLRHIEQHLDERPDLDGLARAVLRPRLASGRKRTPSPWESAQRSMVGALADSSLRDTAMIWFI